MSETHFESLSAAQRDHAHAALAGAFGRATIDGIAPVAGGASTASTFRIDTGNRHYLLRVEGEPSPLRNPHQYVSMRIAAEAGIAPRIRYLDEAARVVVIDFIAQQPLHTFPGGLNALAQALGALLARVQVTPAFPHFVNYPDIVARLFAHVRRTGLFAAGVLDPHMAHLERLRDAYNAGLIRLVSSHNDCIPSNILFDGERLWMIDWESAYRNDPLVDVATVLDSLVRSRDLEDVLLRAWLGHEPDDGLRARLETVRALTRLYYAGVVLSASAAASWVTDDTDLSAPTLAEFGQAIQARRLKPGTPQTRHIMGKMFLRSFLSGGETPSLDAAV
jgi:aminoglycoside phosphotransferase (APT) family kinase protein